MKVPLPMLWLGLWAMAGGMGVTAEPAPEAASGEVNGQRDLPPMLGPDVESIERWMNAAVKTDRIARWKKVALPAGARRLVCFDLQPYSGQPGHHLFVYQASPGGVALLFSSIVWNPPPDVVWCHWRYEAATDSLSVGGDAPGPPFLVIKLTHLWGDPGETK